MVVDVVVVAVVVDSNVEEYFLLFSFPLHCLFSFLACFFCVCILLLLFCLFFCSLSVGSAHTWRPIFDHTR